MWTITEIRIWSSPVSEIQREFVVGLGIKFVAVGSGVLLDITHD